MLDPRDSFGFGATVAVLWLLILIGSLVCVGVVVAFFYLIGVL